MKEKIVKDMPDQSVEDLGLTRVKMGLEKDQKLDQLVKKSTSKMMKLTDDVQMHL